MLTIMTRSLGRIPRCARIFHAALCVATACAVLAAAGPAGAQPPNDDFANRTVVAGTAGTVTGTNDQATTEPSEPAFSGLGGASVWWAWTAPESGCATVNTFNSNFNTVLAVYTGADILSLSQQGGSNNFGSTETSQVIFPAVAGTEYQIQVDGIDATTTGDIVLNYDVRPLVAAPPVNPTPFDGETTTVANILFDWEDIAGAQFYEVLLFGTPIAVTTESQYQVPSPFADGIYQWQVEARNNCSSTVSLVFSFGVCPPVFLPPVSPSPADGETTHSQLSVLDWEDSPGAAVYNVYFNGLFSTNTVVSQVPISPPVAAGPHTWFVEAVNSCDTTVSAVWSFCINEVPRSPNPVNNSVVCISPDELQWDGLEGVEFDVYFDGMLVDTTTGTTTTITPPAAGPHTWQVVSKTSCGNLPSPIWTFDVTPGGTPNANMWITDGVVNCVVTSGSTIYLGGNFNNVGPATGGGFISRRNLAALDAATGIATGWNPDADGHVHAMAIHQDRIYIGGDFYTISGVSRERLAAVDESGALLGWAPFTNDRVRAITTDGTRVFVGGDFTSVSLIGRSRLAAIDAATGAVTGWNPNPDGPIHAIALGGGRMFVGGVFDTIALQPRNSIAEVDPISGGSPDFDPNCDLYVYALVIDGQTLYVGGNFNIIGGQFRKNMAALDLTTTGSARPGWVPDPNATVNSIAIFDNILYCGGHFSALGPNIRPRLTALDKVTGDIFDCVYQPNAVVRSVATIQGRLVVGGDFTFFGSTFAQGAGFFGSLLSAAGVDDWQSHGNPVPASGN